MKILEMKILENISKWAVESDSNYAIAIFLIWSIFALFVTGFIAGLYMIIMGLVKHPFHCRSID